MSTFRADLVSGLVTIANTYRTAHPTLLRKVWSARPGTFGGEIPCAFIGARSEQSQEDAGTVTRTITTSVVIVDTFADNEQTLARMDVLVDGLASAYRLNSNALLSGGIIDFVGSVEDGDIEQPATDTRPAVFYRASFLSITAHIQEGRV